MLKAEQYIQAALIGKAGETLVAAELMRRGVHVAHPAYDGGIDLLAYREQSLTHVIPIQVKARSGSGYNFQRSWFDIDGLILVQVWYVKTDPQFYVFNALDQVEEALGPVHSTSPSWANDGRYSVTEPGPEIIERMQRHRDQWSRITDRL